MASKLANQIELEVNPTAQNLGILEDQEVFLETEIMAILAETVAILEAMVQIIEAEVFLQKRSDLRKNSTLLDKLVMKLQKVEHLLCHN